MNTEIVEKTLGSLFLGDMNGNEWLYSIFLIGIGAFLWALYRILNRKDKTVPFAFRIWFRNIDNLIAAVISMILIYILIRFYSGYQAALLNYLPEGFKLTPYFAMVLLGFGLHKLSETIGKKAKKL